MNYPGFLRRERRFLSFAFARMDRGVSVESLALGCLAYVLVGIALIALALRRRPSHGE